MKRQTRRPLLRSGSAIAIVVYAVCGSVACGTQPDSSFSATASATVGEAGVGASGSDDASAAQDSGSLVLVPPDDLRCDGGCEDAGACVGAACPVSPPLCGAARCAAGEVCSFQSCVTPGATCIDTSDCPSGQYCEYSLGDEADGGSSDAGTLATADGGACIGSASQMAGRCLPQPPTCGADAGSEDAGALTCLEQCEYHPPATTFSPVLAYAWGGDVVKPFSTDVMMAPIVLPLEDTNCDGKVDSRDIPDIVFTSFTGGNYHTAGVLHAISVRGAKLADRWATAADIAPGTQLAGGDIDGNPGNEVVACGDDGSVRAFHGDGSSYWVTPGKFNCDMPSVADLDGDGKPEVVIEGAILDGATGAVKTLIPSDATFVLSDIDGDGKLDIVKAGSAYHADGTLIVDTGVAGDWPAIGDFDKDGKPEIVSVQYGTHSISIWHYDPTQASGFSWMRQGVDINGALPQHCATGSAGATEGGGPPTVADFNGDGTPDVALAGGIGYTVLDGAKLVDSSVANVATLMWASVTTDCSSAATGSSIFDFTGGGRPQVLYSDQQYLRIYDGPTGNVLFSTCNTTGTLEEYPLVADVDNDGHADIIVVSNAYASGNAQVQCNDGVNPAQAGVRVFSDAKADWVRTRAIWNEHAYHITNVNDDGTIPKHELANWTQPGLDNFRQNKQPGGEFAAPDAVVSVVPQCGPPSAAQVIVRNIGEAALPAGVIVDLYAGAPPSGTKLASLATDVALYSAESEALSFALQAAEDGGRVDGLELYAVVEDPSPSSAAWHECRTDNNTSAAVTVACSGPK